MEKLIINCSDCGIEIKEDDIYCLNCNSVNKTIVLEFQDNLTLKNKLSGKVKDYSKPIKKDKFFILFRVVNDQIMENGLKRNF